MQQKLHSTQRGGKKSRTVSVESRQSSSVLSTSGATSGAISGATPFIRSLGDVPWTVANASLLNSMSSSYRNGVLYLLNLKLISCGSDQRHGYQTSGHTERMEQGPARPTGSALALHAGRESKLRLPPRGVKLAPRHFVYYFHESNFLDGKQRCRVVDWLQVWRLGQRL